MAESTHCSHLPSTQSLPSQVRQGDISRENIFPFLALSPSNLHSACYKQCFTRHIRLPIVASVFGEVAVDKGWFRLCKIAYSSHSKVSVCSTSAYARTLCVQVHYRDCHSIDFHIIPHPGW